MWSKYKVSSTKYKDKSQLGQSLLEVVVVIAVGLIVISALVFATISGLRNAQFAQNQSIATKLAQEGIEKVKGIRDRNEGIIFAGFDPANPQKTDFSFNDLWAYSMSEQKCTLARYCTFSFKEQLSRGDDFEELGEFKRQVLISDEATTFQKEKTVTVIVKWSDFSGDHESRLTTILSKI